MASALSSLPGYRLNEAAGHKPTVANATKAATLTGLRALLAEKFPQAPQHEAGGYSLPLSPLSIAPPLELPLGRVTEVTGSLASGGLFIEALLRSTYERRGMMALVDAASSFDPVPLLEDDGEDVEGVGFMEGARLERLLWVLCGKAGDAVKAADLLLRDGNLSTVVLDLQMSPLAELRRIPASTWYRFQRILEPTSLLFVVLTPQPMVSSAAERFELAGGWSLQAMRELRAELPVQARRARVAATFSVVKGEAGDEQRIA